VLFETNRNPRLVQLLVLLGANIHIPCYHSHASNIIERMISVATIDLITDPKIKDALHTKWDTKYHHFYPDDIKAAIKCILLIGKRLKWKFDKAITLNIISFVASSWYHP